MRHALVDCHKGSVDLVPLTLLSHPGILSGDTLAGRNLQGISKDIFYVKALDEDEGYRSERRSEGEPYATGEDAQ